MKPNLTEIGLIDDGATFTPIEAGRLLGCTASCVTQWIGKEKIKAIKRGGRYFISGAEIKRAVQAQEEQTNESAAPGTDL